MSTRDEELARAQERIANESALREFGDRIDSMRATFEILKARYDAALDEETRHQVRIEWMREGAIASSYGLMGAQVCHMYGEYILDTSVQIGSISEHSARQGRINLLRVLKGDDALGNGVVALPEEMQPKRRASGTSPN